MRFLANAELYPFMVEPGWETAELGKVTNNGRDFEAVRDGEIIGLISNRTIDECTFSYDF
jgi:hypothetical protein